MWSDDDDKKEEEQEEREKDGNEKGIWRASDGFS